MRSTNFNKKFDYLFIGFNSFLHLLTNADAHLFLNNVKHHMHADSHFYIDIFIPPPSFLYRAPKPKLQPVIFFDTTIKEEATIYETLSYDKATEVASITWEYTRKNDTIYRRFPFKMKMYYPNTMQRLLLDSGLYINNVWGGYDYSSIDKYSSLQIYECTL